jgi:hypothetical protein
MSYSPTALPHFRDALELLLQAHEYARELQRSPWDFALELEALRQAGLNYNDCRWLVYQEYLLHTAAAGPPREAESPAGGNGRLVLTPASCFILTRHGVACARAVLGVEDPACVCDLSAAAGPDLPAAAVHPRWDRDCRELWFGAALVKQFKTAAANQEMILAAFEEEHWPVCVDDPLPPQPEVEPKRRLRDTVGSLNRNQKRFLIRFCSNGNGQSVRWAPVTD